MTVSPPEGVCIALTDPALEENPAWTRLDDPTGYDVAQSWSITRGRSSEFDKTGTGIASVTFKDSTGLLDPTNTTSDFYDTGGTATYLDPMRQIAIALQHPIATTWHTLFRGFLSSQDHDMDMWSDTRGIDTVTWECADGFDLLSALVLTPGVHGNTVSMANFTDVYYEGTPANFDGPPAQPDVFKHVDDRIIQLLDDAGWPGTGAFDVLRDIFSGNCSVQGRVYSRTDQLLAALFDAADAEFVGVANVYMSSQGKVTFRGRLARFNPTNPGYGINTWYAGGVPQALADPTIAPISGLAFRRSKEDIINSVIAAPQNATDADIAGLITEDAVSIAKFGYRGESFTDLQVSAGHTNSTPTTAVEEAKKQAEYIVGNYANPKTRVSTISFRPRGIDDPNANALWDLITQVEIGDQVQLTTSHVGGGGFAGEYFFVEGIRYEAHGMTDLYPDITCDLEVSPVSYYTVNPFGTVDGTI